MALVTINDKGSQDPNLWVLCHEALKPTVISFIAQQITLSSSFGGVHCTSYYCNLR